MKRYVISTIAVLIVLAVILAAFGQQERAAGQRRRGGFMGREGRLKAIEAIEAELAKLKKETPFTRPEGGFQNLSEEERAKFREQMMKIFQERQKTLQTIMAHVFRLQGRRQPEGEGVRYVILSTNDLKPIHDSATKEKAKETAQLLERLIARAEGRRGFGGRRPGSGQRPEGGARGSGRSEGGTRRGQE